MMEDKVEAGEQSRSIVVPSAEDQANTTTGPVLLRDYQTLEPVSMERVNNALELKDDENMVIAPIGGKIMLTMKDCFMDDVVIVPPGFAGGKAQVMHQCQIPIMLDTKPEATHDIGYEIDCGRFPNIEDLQSSAAGQKKAEEQVLAIPAEAFLRQLLDSQNGGDPADLTELVFNNLNFVRRSWCEEDDRFLQLLPYIFLWRYDALGNIEIFVYQRGKESGEGRLAMGCTIGVGGHVNPIDFLSTQAFESITATVEEMEIHNRRGPRLLCEGFWAGIVNSLLREVDEEVIINRTAQNGAISMLSIIEEAILAETKDNAVPASVEEWIAHRTSFFLDLKANAVEKSHLGMFIGIQLPTECEVNMREEILHDVGFRPVSDLWVDDEIETLPTRLECWSRSLVDSIYETVHFIDKELGAAYNKPSKFVYTNGMLNNNHFAQPDVIARIPKEARWKIGTLAGSLSYKYRFYAMNAFVHA